MQVFGELDDEDGVFRGKSHHRNQADDEVGVVGKGFGAACRLRPGKDACQGLVEPASAHDPGGDAEEAKRQDEQYGERNRPALIQRRQAEEDGEQGEGIDVELLVAGALLFEREAGPFDGKARRQFGGEVLHGVHRITRAFARRGATADAHRRVAVVAGGLHRAFFPAEAGDAAKRHLTTAAVGDVQRQQVLRLHTCGGVGLDGYPLQTAFVGEVVDVGGAEVGADDVGDGRDVHALRVSGIAVDVQPQLWRVFHAIRAHLGNFAGGLRCHAEQLVARGKQGVVSGVATVFQHQVEAVGGTERGNGRRA